MGYRMAHWKIERGPRQKFILEDPTRFLDLVALMAIAAAPGLVLLMFVPLPLVMPALSIVSFLIACGIALFAHYSQAERRQPDTPLWELAWAFAVVWVAAGMMSNPRRLIDWLD